MKYFSNINRIHNCWIWFEKEYAVSDIFLRDFFSCRQLLKITKLPTRENVEPTRKNLGTTKYQREKYLEPRNTHGEHFWPTQYSRNTTKARWHDSTRSTKPTMARDQQNLAHSIEMYFSVLGLLMAFNL